MNFGFDGNHRWSGQHSVFPENTLKSLEKIKRQHKLRVGCLNKKAVRLLPLPLLIGMAEGVSKDGPDWSMLCLRHTN